MYCKNNVFFLNYVKTLQTPKSSGNYLYLACKKSKPTNTELNLC